MMSLSEIYEKNAATFYDNRTQHRYSLTPRYGGLAIVAALLCYAFKKTELDLYTGFVAALSILVGFSFNVLFYLAAGARIEIANPDSEEQAFRANRANLIAEEVFYNVSYFNLVAIACVVSSLALMMANTYEPYLIPNLLNIAPATIISVNATIGLIGKALVQVLLFSAYFFFMDSFFSFLRIIKRMTFFFKERSELTTR